jgi:hypothetical protein
MIDPKVCDRKFPYRWRSSVAVFPYQPAEDQQTYDEMIVSYLKVACTITSFQPNPEEVGLKDHGRPLFCRALDLINCSLWTCPHFPFECSWITAKELTVRRRTGSSAEDSIFVEEPTGGLESYPPFLMLKFSRDFRCLKRRARLQRVGSK